MDAKVSLIIEALLITEEAAVGEAVASTKTFLQVNTDQKNQSWFSSFWDQWPNVCNLKNQIYFSLLVLD